MTGKQIADIIQALEILGISGDIELRQIADQDRIEVTVNGEYFGVWDAVKNTFVD